ncbi:putative RNA-directed DNA polymerase, eukaryota, reverse transcriptase zinc-binding domain protein [Tanacetum coccineum]
MWAFLRLFIQNHTGKIILFGDLNKVRNETESSGSSFYSEDVAIFNSFIHDFGLIDLTMRGRMFTWMNTAGSKLRKVDRFLISDGVLQSYSDVQVTVLDRVWSDHNLILLHYGSTKSLHNRLKGLKVQLKVWYSRTKEVKYSRKKNIMSSLRNTEEKIDAGCVNDEDKVLRVNGLQELDGLEKLEYMDLVQKARVKWGVEGDKNLNVFHDIINSRRKSRMIQAGLVSAETSILLNGSPTSYFSLKRGLRQGDPLSHFLFIIVMEGLHVALMDGLVANMFRGVKVGSSDIPLSYLFYADDVIIIFDRNQNDIDNIIRILNVFYIASDLNININKSNLYGVGISSSDIDRMTPGTGCAAGSFPFSYHGLPIGSNMGRIVNWKELIDRFKARLLGWKTNLLSIGGRLTFIKSVLGSLVIYQLSISKAPEAVIKALESLRASFFGVHPRIKRS